MGGGHPCGVCPEGGQLVAGGGGVMHANDDATYMTPCGCPNFFALGLENKSTSHCTEVLIPEHRATYRMIDKSR